MHDVAVDRYGLLRPRAHCATQTYTANEHPERSPKAWPCFSAAIRFICSAFTNELESLNVSVSSIVFDFRSIWISCYFVGACWLHVRKPAVHIMWYCVIVRQIVQSLLSI